MNNSQEFICDDRMYKPGGLFDQIRAMTEEEFKEFIKEVEKEKIKRSRFTIQSKGQVVFLYPKTRKDKYVQGRITGTDHKMQGNAE